MRLVARIYMYSVTVQNVLVMYVCIKHPYSFLSFFYIYVYTRPLDNRSLMHLFGEQACTQKAWGQGGAWA
jgi:hypothetical protein